MTRFTTSIARSADKVGRSRADCVLAYRSGVSVSEECVMFGQSYTQMRRIARDSRTSCAAFFRQLDFRRAEQR
jgi:hypothetical protein